jgi:hypothetical protein
MILLNEKENLIKGRKSKLKVLKRKDDFLSEAKSKFEKTK